MEASNIGSGELYKNLQKRGPFVVWLPGHMDPMQLAGSGPWVHKSPTGEPIQASLLPHRDGISGSNLKGHHLVLMREVSCMVLRHHQTAEKVEVG